MSSLEQLLVVQEHDSAAEDLRHRRATLPEREVLTRAEAEVAALDTAARRGAAAAATRSSAR